MTDAEKVAKALRMRAAGATYPQIAQHFGVAKSTIRRWCNPGEAERTRQLSLAAKRRRKTPCPDCGCTVGYENAGELCEQCKHEQRYGEQNRRIVEFWEQGCSAVEIADELGLTQTQVLSRLDSWRRLKGRPISMHRLGGGEAEREERHKRVAAMAREGMSNAFIAEQIGTTPGSAGMMVQTLRRNGWDIPPRARRGIASRGEVIALWNEGLTGREIAERLGYASGSSVCGLISNFRNQGHEVPWRARRQKAAA